MTIYTSLPHRFAWSPDQLADAVPKRLSDLFVAGPPASETARGIAHARRRSFLPARQAALFRIGG